MGTPKQQWKDELARMRHERDSFMRRTQASIERARECRKRKDWTGAMVADGLASEYRAERKRYATEAAKIKAQWRLR